MRDETRKEQAERIARMALELLEVRQIARVDELQPGTWKLTIYGERVIEVRFETHAREEHMLMDLRRKVREAMGH